MAPSPPHTRTRYHCPKTPGSGTGDSDSGFVYQHLTSSCRWTSACPKYPRSRSRGPCPCNSCCKIPASRYYCRRHSRGSCNGTSWGCVVGHAIGVQCLEGESAGAVPCGAEDPVQGDEGLAGLGDPVVRVLGM